MRALSIVVTMLLMAALPLLAQSVMERSPNLHGVWGAERGHAAFVFSHRFALLEGGDELVNFPTLTFAVGLPLGLTAGLDYTSNSEIVDTQRGGNETQYWVKRSIVRRPHTALAGLLAYNTAARSTDAALSGRHRIGSLSVMSELRGASRLFGADQAGLGASLGAVLHLTPYLGIAGDVGRVLVPDSLATTWSAGVAIEIPGSPHTFSLHATNVGALTLQGAGRERVILPDKIRYGFTFTVPLGSGGRWARIFRSAPPVIPQPASVSETGENPAARVELRMVAYTPGEVRIRAGESVEWLNLDSIEHTVTATEGTWGSRALKEGERYVQQFSKPGRYPYYCLPHPQMTGVVVVDE